MTSRWRYDGPVMSFNTCICGCWHGETMAATSGEAKRNLKYQFKKQNNRLATTKIDMPGKLTIVT